jgi:ubiquitin C-terminal hydrolase
MIKPPKILCFHLNRLCYNQNGDLYMNRTQVDFGETLRPIHPSLNPHGHDLEYKLCSVIEHYGSVMGGHYVAARRIHNPIDQEDEGKFLFCNDSFVNIIPVEKVLEANPFMIFYERVF